jgi:hypothetical protein
LSGCQSASISCCPAGIRSLFRGRADGDHAAAAALLHPREKALEGEERGEQVAVDRRAPAVLRYLLQRHGRRQAPARVGDEDVHPAELGLDLAADRLDPREVAQLAGHRDGRAAVPGDGGGDVADGGLVTPVHGHRGAPPRELDGDGRADAPRTAGDQGDLAV